MRIVSPVSTLQETELLIISGVSSLILDVRENPRTSALTNGSGKDAGAAGTITSLNRLKKIVNRAHLNGVRTYVYLDDESYSDKSMRQVISLIRQIRSRCEIDGILTGNAGLILAIREEKIFTDILLSQEELVLNRQTVRFWNDFKVTKIFLPSYLEIDEIETMVSGMRQNQFFVTVFRGWSHPGDIVSTSGTVPATGRKFDPTHSLDLVFCGLCNIPGLYKAGVDAVIVDLKGGPCHSKTGLVTVVKRLVDMASDDVPPTEITGMAREEMECQKLCEHGYLCLNEDPNRIEIPRIAG